MQFDVFIDTSAFYALCDSNDARHDEAAAFLAKLSQENSRLCTSNYVLAETYGLIMVRRGRNDAQIFLSSLRGSSVEIIQIEEADQDSAEAVLGQYSDQNFSYVDAASFAVIDRLEIRRAFAFDVHFSIFHSKAGALIVNQ